MNTDPPQAGDRLVRTGGVVFALGALATLITVAPLFLGTEPFPAPAYFVCMLMGVGFALAAAGLLRSAAAERRAVRAASGGGAQASATGESCAPAGADSHGG